MKSRLLIGIAIFCIISGCKSRESSNPSETVSDEKQTITAQTDDGVSEQNDDSHPQKHIEHADCSNGSILKDDQCVCKDGSRHLGVGWYCLTEGQRCFLAVGCKYGEKTYPIFTSYLKDQFFCGDKLAPDTASEYECGYNSINQYNWKCKQNTCHCGEDLIINNSICTIKINTTNDDLGNTDENQMPQETNLPVPEDKISDDAIQKANEPVQEKTETTNESKDTLHEDLALHSDDSDDEDNEYDDGEDEDNETNPYEKYYGYICKNNTWIYNNAVTTGDAYCDGIPLSAIGKKEDLFKSELFFGNNDFNFYESGENAPIYHCREHQWVCNNPKGCPCFDGQKTRHISMSEVCENKQANCNKAKLPVPRGKEFKKQNNFWVNIIRPNLGNGDQMDDTELETGENTSTDDFHKEFYRSIFPVAISLGETLIRYEARELFTCLKETGCHTEDGRHYPQYATIGFDGEDEAYHDYHESLMYHIDAGFDTMKESISELGECVLDRDDDLVRYSLANGADSFVCDQSTCTCGITQCRLGEICDNGKCRADACKAHGKTRCLYNTDLANGFLPHLDPIDDIDAPDNTENCDSEDKSMYYDVIECKGGHRYCHGLNNPPILAPKDPDGYLCKEVTALPNIEAKDHLKAWVCDKDKGCACGESLCQSSEACIDGVCVNVPQPVEYCNGQPLLKGYSCVYQDFCGDNVDVGQKCTKETCVCGESACPKDAYCSDGHCLQESSEGEYNHYEPSYYYPAILSKDYDNLKCINEHGCRCNGKDINKDDECTIPCFGDGRLDEEGCWCGQTKLKDPEEQTCYKKDDQYFILCNIAGGCECGDIDCPMTTYCSQNKCIDPLTGQAIKSSSNELEPVTPCPDESCACGDNICSKGQFCIGGLCRDYVLARITDDNRSFYYDFVPSPGVPPTMELYLTAFWNNIESGFLPDAYAVDYGYSYSLSTRECSRCCDEHDYCIGSGDKRCALASGCDCGHEKCSYGEKCSFGKCVKYDIHIQELCGTYESFMEDRLEYKNLNCYCAGTSHHIDVNNIIVDEDTSDFSSVTTNNFECTAFGWRCDNRNNHEEDSIKEDIHEEDIKTCPCGNVKCPFGSYCIMPGVCAPPQNP